MAVLDHVPEGWKVVDGCTNTPAGYLFINNNNSRFGGEYQHALIEKTVFKGGKKNEQSDTDGKTDKGPGC